MAACDHYGLHAEQRRPLESLSVVEVGCGGGILSETLAAMGGKVTAIDAAEESIEVAREVRQNQLYLRLFESESPTFARLTFTPSSLFFFFLTVKHLKRNTVVPDGRLSYVATTGEALASENRRFDVVVSSEVVEHVVDPPSFCRTLAELCKPGGLVVMSTINRTVWSYSLAIVAAERILGMAPRGEANDPSFHLSIRTQDAAILTHPLLLSVPATRLQEPTTGTSS